MSDLRKADTCGINRDHDDRDIVITDGQPEPCLTAWQRTFRVGIVPQLTTAGLQGLKEALERDDPRLITGATTNPPPLHCVADWPVQGCCPLCWGLLNGLKPSDVSVGLMEQGFAIACNLA